MRHTKVIRLNWAYLNSMQVLLLFHSIIAFRIYRVYRPPVRQITLHAVGVYHMPPIPLLSRRKKNLYFTAVIATHCCPQVG